MTPAAFWAAVRAAGEWEITGRDKVRNDQSCCPLSAVLGIPGVCSPESAAAALQIPVLVARRIATAADWDDEPWRPLLLRELGLA